MKDPPHRTALAFAAGVFIAFSPLLGLHTLIAIAFAFAFGLNRVAVLAGAWINVWALAPCYAFGTFVGALLLGVDAGDLSAIDWSQGIGALGSTLSTLLWPILLGNTLLGLSMALPAYVLSRKFLESRAHRTKGGRDGDADPAPPSTLPRDS
ncbi:MAG: DUF2062 domain-containing protein [Vicinamibacteria bacterium]|nr:DUF2062 domain-containing protein [Vicinamibacteria bacterium]